MTELAAHGIEVTLPTGWEGRVFRRPPSGEVAASAADGPPAPDGESTHAIVHVATIALPPGMGDFASGAVDRLGPSDAVIVLFEYDPASAGEPLFQAAGHPAGARRRRLQPRGAAAGDPRPGRRAAVLPRGRTRVLPLRRAGRLQQPAAGRARGQHGARHADHRPARRRPSTTDEHDHRAVDDQRKPPRRRRRHRRPRRPPTTPVPSDTTPSAPVSVLAGPFAIAAVLLAVGGALKAVRPRDTAQALTAVGLRFPAFFSARTAVRVGGAVEAVVGVGALARRRSRLRHAGRAVATSRSPASSSSRCAAARRSARAVASARSTRRRASCTSSSTRVVGRGRGGRRGRRWRRAARRARRPAVARDPVPVPPRDRMLARVPRVHLAPEDHGRGPGGRRVSTSPGREQGRRVHQLVGDQDRRVARTEVEPARVPHRFGDGGLRGRRRRVRAGDPAGHALHPHHRLRRWALHRRLDRVLLHHQQRAQRVPARELRRGLVARRLLQLLQRHPLLHRLHAELLRAATCGNGFCAGCTECRCARRLRHADGSTATTSATGSATRRSGSPARSRAGSSRARRRTPTRPRVQHRGRGRQLHRRARARARLHAAARHLRPVRTVAVAAVPVPSSTPAPGTRLDASVGCPTRRMAPTASSTAPVGRRRASRSGPRSTSGIAATARRGSDSYVFGAEQRQRASGEPQPNGGAWAWSGWRSTRRQRRSRIPPGGRDASRHLRVRAAGPTTRSVVSRRAGRARVHRLDVARGRRRPRIPSRRERPHRDVYVFVRGADHGDLRTGASSVAAGRRGSRSGGTRRPIRSRVGTPSGSIVFVPRHRQRDLRSSVRSGSRGSAVAVARWDRHVRSRGVQRDPPAPVRVRAGHRQRALVPAVRRRDRGPGGSQLGRWAPPRRARSPSATRRGVVRLRPRQRQRALVPALRRRRSGPSGSHSAGSLAPVRGVPDRVRASRARARRVRSLLASSATASAAAVRDDGGRRAAGQRRARRSRRRTARSAVGAVGAPVDDRVAVVIQNGGDEAGAHRSRHRDGDERATAATVTRARQRRGLPPGARAGAAGAGVGAVPRATACRRARRSWRRCGARRSRRRGPARVLTVSDPAALRAADRRGRADARRHGHEPHDQLDGPAARRSR